MKSVYVFDKDVFIPTNKLHKMIWYEWNEEIWKDFER